MTEGSVLELELRHAPLSGEHSEEADEHEVREGSQGAGMLPASVKGAEPNSGPPHDAGEHTPPIRVFDPHRPRLDPGIGAFESYENQSSWGNGCVLVGPPKKQ